MEWLRQPLEAEDRIAAEIRSWEGTRFAAGQSCKGVATDCEGFARGVIRGLGHSHIVPLDVEGPFQAGDVLVTEYRGEKHAFIFGKVKWRLWHASRAGVARTSLPAILCLKARILEAYRPVFP